MVNLLRRAARALHQDTRGAMSVEKILILALVALPIIIVLLAFRKYIVEWFQGQQAQLQP